MTDPRTISIQDYNYPLPEHRIAKYPLDKRDGSKLLVYRRGEISLGHYSDLPSFLPANSLLVYNDTRVMEARILFQKPTGGVIEIFCLEPGDEYADIGHAMHQQGHVSWKCLLGGASKWKPGEILEKKVSNGEITLQARYIAREKDSFVIHLSWSPGELSFSELLHHAGEIPLPPYLKRKPATPDAERYQTVYAKEEGSVAAPTAGLHFTRQLLEELGAKQIPAEFVTLHVGAGTFKPVKTGTIGEHVMHAEWIDVSRETIQNIKRALEETIIAVGTTSFRTLESLYWIGVKLAACPGEDQIEPVKQWDPYDHRGDLITAEQSLGAILEWMSRKNKSRLITQTGILVAPGYQCRIVKGLITNFHQPRSTLLLLIAAYIGEDWKKIYSYALENGFRFLSYGDGSLLLNS